MFPPIDAVPVPIHLPHLTSLSLSISFISPLDVTEQFTHLLDTFGTAPLTSLVVHDASSWAAISTILPLLVGKFPSLRRLSFHRDPPPYIMVDQFALTAFCASRVMDASPDVSAFNFPSLRCRNERESGLGRDYIRGVLEYGPLALARAEASEERELVELLNALKPPDRHRRRRWLD